MTKRVALKSVAAASLLGAMAVLASCTGSPLELDNNSRALHQLFNAPVHDNDVVGEEAQAWSIVDERVNTPFAGPAQRAEPLFESGETARPSDE